MQNSPIPAVSVALVRKGFVLLVRRRREPSRGAYAFPGGRAEPGEKLEEAARRELMEETSLLAGELEPFRKLIVYADAPGSPIFELTVFTGDSAAGELNAGDDADAAGWFSAEEMERLITVPGVAEIARELLAGSR